MPRNEKFSTKVRGSGMTDLAVSFALPHEMQPMRLPLVPVCYTANCSLMAERTVRVKDASARRAFLCRSPTFPLWMEQELTDFCAALSDSTIKVQFSVVGAIWPLPNWDKFVTTPGLLDGSARTANAVAHSTPLYTGPSLSGIGIFIPNGSVFCFEVDTVTTTSTTAQLQVTFEYVYYNTTLKCIALTSVITSNKMIIKGVAGTTTLDASGGTLIEGMIPYGAVTVTDIQVAASFSPAPASASYKLGYSAGGGLTNPTGSLTLMYPFAAPPEIGTSVVPYERTRANATAALFTNVGAQLYQEGTVLAGRLRGDSIDPQLFSSANIDAVQPMFRYYGPLQKGLYTFTLPNDTSTDMEDNFVYAFTVNTGSRANMCSFNPDVGMYNAIIFSDLGSTTGSGDTQLAVSQYTHLEFETVSSLFKIGASSLSLEDLHRAELALVKFGTFHENPLHWAAIMAAVRRAAVAAAPYVIPYVQKGAQALVDKGVRYVKQRAAGDRMMRAPLVAPLPRKGRTPRRPKPRPKRK